jgi:hypothetical protein
MPFALAIVGIVLLVSALRGTSGSLFAALKADFTGSGNYIYWVVAILVIGSIGYIKKLQPISDAFLALVLIVLMISNKGFFAQFMTALSSTDTSACTQVSSSSSTPGVTNPIASLLPSSMVNSGTLLGTQATQVSPVTATPNQSYSQALSNTWTNLGSALNSGSFGGN